VKCGFDIVSQLRIERALGVNQPASEGLVSWMYRDTSGRLAGFFERHMPTNQMVANKYERIAITNAT